MSSRASVGCEQRPGSGLTSKRRVRPTHHFSLGRRYTFARMTFSESVRGAHPTLVAHAELSTCKSSWWYVLLYRQHPAANSCTDRSTGAGSITGSDPAYSRNGAVRHRRLGSLARSFALHLDAAARRCGLFNALVEQIWGQTRLFIITAFGASLRKRPRPAFGQPLDLILKTTTTQRPSLVRAIPNLLQQRGVHRRLD